MSPWWNKKYGKESVCAITKTRLRPGNSVFLKCKHGFCYNALKQWVSMGNKTCPLCRKEICKIL